jgi:uracil-DNA glycosylase family 4
MLIGQNPGFSEDQQGLPFVGPAGQYLDSLLFHCSVPRESVYITNLAKCLTLNNRALHLSEITACAHWLDLELGVVQPRIIVAMGAAAISYFLGPKAGTVERLHGRPVPQADYIVLPVYHPAAALHNTALLRQCAEDFQVLRGLAKGDNWQDYIMRDEYPNPVYRIADNPAALAEMEQEIHNSEVFAVDTEISRGKLWSYQISTAPGTAWFVPVDGPSRVDLTKFSATVIMHNYLFDIRYAQVNEFVDSMTMAYLCTEKNTPILKADLSWEKAGSIRIGDVLVGFDDDIPREKGKAIPTKNNGYVRRHLHKSIVEKVRCFKAACFDVALSDGRHEICTGDHQWQVLSAGHHSLKWKTVNELAARLGRIHTVNGRICNPAGYTICSLVPGPWDILKTYAAGWLAGIIDGEGSLATGSSVEGAGLTISQNKGAVNSQIEQSLRDLGFNPSNKLYKDSSRPESANQTYVIGISGMANVMKLLGQVHPVRVARDFWEGKAFPQDQMSPTIMSITPAGEREVVAITTSTGTYIADGLASHNCGQPQGLKELASRLCGVKMVDYMEMVRPGQNVLALPYLLKASEGKWKDPPKIEVTRWNNKIGGLVTKHTKPWNISRKIAKILDDYKTDPATDLWGLWQGIAKAERAVVECDLGPMPESSLADIPYDQAVQYAARDADVALRVYYKLKKIVEDMDLDNILNIDLGILPMVNSMMQNGMAVDIEHYRKLSDDYDIRMKVKAAELAGMVGHSFNPASSPQVAAVVYKELGFTPTRFTPTKEISTDDQELKKTGHPVARGIIQYRGLLKLKSTYSDNMIRSAHPDEQGVPRIHTVIKTTRTETGRLSSSKDSSGEGANLQNIPTRSQDGKDIKRGIVAPDGKLLVEGDYSQIEVVVQAHMARCKGLIDLFDRGEDPHTSTASKIFGVSYEDAKQDKYRYPAKCFHPDTEVLTPDGWKKIVDLVLGVDSVMQAIPGKSGSVVLEWAVPTEVFTTRHPSARLIHLKNHGMDLRVTPDHRMLAWQADKPKVVMPEELNRQRYWANAGLYKGGDIVVEEILLRLAVATEADGCYNYGKIRFGFYDPEKIERLRGMVKGSATESDNNNGALRPVHCFHLDRELSGRIKDILTPGKEFPWWWLNLTPYLRTVVLDELKYWDGGKYHKWTQSLYSSGKLQSREVVQALASITNRKSRRDKSHNYILIKDHNLTRGENLITTEEKYEGEVACLSVPSSFILVRDKGIPVIVGQTMNFGVIYLISGQGLSEQITEYISDLVARGVKVEIDAWDAATCDKYIAEWFKVYPEVRDYQMEQLAHARRYGYVRDLFGRIRYIPEVRCPIRYIQETGARMAANMPIQSTAQGIIKLAMGELWIQLPHTEWVSHSKFLMQIHDSLVAEITDNEDILQPYVRWMSRIMTGVVELLAPVRVDFKVGKRWGDLAKLVEGVGTGKGEAK